ncbi:Retrovirus-related Pol polyprotein from transposon opus [Gossypium australe]|uniref:Retrovirus-related Pol polyprotein from transposon opus n=1 Tax=Gossypium australe TaxID=47621 RepID=A0A5B6WPL8_9ROSI|nr:Retrovirus-related Pol polyprotein from transposon opus [Gossypium australe]
MIKAFGELMDVKQIENGSRRKDPPMLELKPLPAHLKYAYLGDNNTLPKPKKSLGWIIADIKGISPTTCMPKILLEDCHGKSIVQ